MSVSLGDLDNRVFMGLAAAAEFLALEDVHNATVQRLNARTMQSRTSDINVLLGTTEEFTPTETPYDVTSLIGKGVPAWVEVKGYIVDSIQQWYPVRVVNMNQLNDYQRLGVPAVAFYGEESAGDTAQPTQYMAWTYLPNNAVRIRFDRDGQRTDLEADMILPDNLAELIVLEAQNSLIPRIKLAIAMRLRKDEEGRKLAGGLMAALDGIQRQNLVDIVPLDTQWRVWAYRDRAAQTNFNLPTPKGQTLYPGGRNNTWGPYSSGGGGY